MTLIDSSLWIEHLKHPVPELEELLSTERALIHPMVLGELCLSPFRNAEYEKAMVQWSLLEQLPVADNSEVMDLITRFKLWGRGVGWVDCHLMAAAREAHCHLLTRDRALKAAWLGVRPKV